MMPDQPIRSVDELVEAARKGRRLKYLYFWGHTPPASGAIGAHVLSQWFPSPFEVDGERFATAEHWMMVAKARLFGDHEAAEKILASASPAQAKNLGRTVRGYDDAVWREHRFDIVARGSQAKFAASPDLRTYLVATGQRILVEASPQDRIWGIGLTGDSPAAANPEQWRGLNLLGFALMEARDRLA